MDTMFTVLMMVLSFFVGVLFSWFNRDAQEEHDFDTGYSAGWADAFALSEEAAKEAKNERGN